MDSAEFGFRSWLARQRHIALPRWLGATQLGSFGNDSALRELATAVVAYMSDADLVAAIRPLQPIPGLVVWLRQLPWNQHAYEQVSTVLTRDNRRLEVFDADIGDERVIRRIASANLLIVSLDGTQADALVHYVTGAVVARPQAGQGKGLLRRVLMIEEQEGHLQGRGFVAEGVRRCEDVVRLRKVGAIREAVEEFLGEYRAWLRGGLR